MFPNLDSEPVVLPRGGEPEPWSRRPEEIPGLKRQRNAVVLACSSRVDSNQRVLLAEPAARTRPGFRS